MLGDQEIVQRFLASHRQVHPEVVHYLKEQKNSRVIDEILARIPEDAMVVLPRHIPGWQPERDGTRFLTDPELEIIYGHAKKKRR